MLHNRLLVGSNNEHDQYLQKHYHKEAASRRVFAYKIHVP